MENQRIVINQLTYLPTYLNPLFIILLVGKFQKGNLPHLPN
jgi:hypothetical protein